MAEAVEMEILQAQMEELRDRLNALQIGEDHRGPSKDVSLVAGIKEWTGESKGRPVHEFLTQIETLAKVSGWTSQDKALIVKAKLQGLALQFLQGREELGKDRCPYEVLKQALIERFSDKLPDQYYYTRLQEAVQERDEGAEEFGDRCRKMCQRTIRKVQDEETQRVINEEAERRLLAAYIHGLKGIVGQQVQFQMPSTMEQAVRLAVTVENAERHRQMKDGPRKIFTTRRDAKCYRCAGIGHYARDCRREPDRALPGWKSGGDQCGRRGGGPCREPQVTRRDRDRDRGGSREQDSRRPTRPWVSSGDARSSGIQCIHCQEFGHLRRECPKVFQAIRHPNGRSSALRSPASNPPTVRE
jgi:hypothetical protein